MNAYEMLSEVWRDLLRRQACVGTAAQVFDELVRAYSEPHRHYHTIEHVASLLRLLDEHGRGVIDRNAITLAILFHDVIHDPARHDNEQASANLAGERLASLGFPAPLIVKVKSYTLATKHGQNALTINDADLALVLDLDLAILAAPPAVYCSYSQAIRREYVHLPDELFRPGRRRILEGFLARDRIYRTEQLHARWQGRARANIAGEMEGLI